VHSATRGMSISAVMTFLRIFPADGAEMGALRSVPVCSNVSRFQLLVQQGEPGLTQLIRHLIGVV
jgi:hypothetical protein